MSVPAIAYKVEKRQQDHIALYVRNCVESLSNTWNLRDQFLIRDKYYQREMDNSVEQIKALTANRAGDPYKMQNLQVPVILPQVESQLAYLAGVYLLGYPIFGIVSTPATVDIGLQMEAVIGENSLRFGWPSQLIMFMRDGLKYNFGALEATWAKCKVPAIINDPASATPEVTEQVYEGNRLRRLDPYNLIWDKRVQPSRLHIDGEFAGYTEIMSRIQLKQLLLDLNKDLTMNGREAFERGAPSVTINGSDSWFYIPQVNTLAYSGVTVYPSTNWLSWAMLDGGTGNEKGITYNNIYEVTTLYGRIIPQDFQMAVQKRNQPQIWKFIVVNRNTVIYVERQTNAHNWLPILLCQPNEDGLAYQTKSFLDNVIPFQSISTALWSGAIESLRREVYDRLLYDASRVRKEDIDKVTSVARIPVKSSAYGKPVGDAVHAFPYRGDNVAQTIQIAETINSMADVANGQNKVDRGQFQKGNKTRAEFVTTMGNSNSRQQLAAIGLEYQVFQPLKEIIKLNMLQYQPNANIYHQGAKKMVAVRPQDIRSTAMNFKVSDGLLPTDTLLSADLFQVFMQTLQTSPLMMAQYDVVGAFVYWCKTQGAQWMDDFKRSPEETKALMEQMMQMKQAEKAPGPQQGTPPTGGSK